MDVCTGWRVQAVDYVPDDLYRFGRFSQNC